MERDGRQRPSASDLTRALSDFYSFLTQSHVPAHPAPLTSLFVSAPFLPHPSLIFALGLACIRVSRNQSLGVNLRLRHRLRRLFVSRLT